MIRCLGTIETIVYETATVCAVKPIGMLARVPYGDVMRMLLMGNLR